MKHARTHARTHAQTDTSTHERPHVYTLARPHTTHTHSTWARMYVCASACAPSAVCLLYACLSVLCLFAFVCFVASLFLVCLSVYFFFGPRVLRRRTGKDHGRPKGCEDHRQELVPEWMEDLVAAQQERLDHRVQRSRPERWQLSSKTPFDCGCHPQCRWLRRVLAICHEQQCQGTG